MKDAVKRCPHCAAKMVEYRHSINKNMVKAMAFMFDRGGIVEFKEFEAVLTFNQQSNFQKLKYWGVVRKVEDEDGERVGGKWALTSKGKGFLCGEIAIHKTVVTYRNKVVEYEGQTLYVKDVSEPMYRRREDYLADSRPRAKRPDPKQESWDV